MAHNLFEPAREEIWRQLRTQIGGRYVEGGFWKGHKVEATHGGWLVTLDTYLVSSGNVTVVYTRMRAPYVNRDRFRFTIYRRGLFSEFAKARGMRDVDVGEGAFDRDFIVKATDENRVRQILSNPRLRDLITRQPELKLTVAHDDGWFRRAFPEGVDELSFVAAGAIKDVDRLRRLYELFAETLDELCRTERQKSAFTPN